MWKPGWIGCFQVPTSAGAHLELDHSCSKLEEVNVRIRQSRMLDYNRNFKAQPTQRKRMLLWKFGLEDVSTSERMVL